MSSDQNVFEDIEQDNNPSFYGDQSFLNNPYGNNGTGAIHNSNVQTKNESNPNDEDLLNRSIVLSNKIAKLMDDKNITIEIIGTERLINTSVMVYVIELGNKQDESKIVVKRRYSEFKSLRETLQKLFPTVIIPPIPEKHTIFTYLVNSINNSRELDIIETRKRHFKFFLTDIILNSDPKIRDCPLFHKFLDPNYELCWSNAMNEPPVNLIPRNLLLANPINPTDQNGLYTLLPGVNGFDFSSSKDTLSSLSKLNKDLNKLGEHVEASKLNSNNTDKSPDNFFSEIPSKLINQETIFHQNVRILNDTTRVNSKTLKDLRSIITNLIELGGNLNNFSLQVHELNSTSNTLSTLIERFGSTIDTNFLAFESYLANYMIPNWQEPLHQITQYYLGALQIIKFYKYKVIQFKLLHKLKFNKCQELSALSSNLQSHIKLSSLKDIDSNSASLQEAIKKIETRQELLKKRGLSSKKSWYGLFGGGAKQSFTLPVKHQDEQHGSITDQQVHDTLEGFDLNNQYQNKINHMEKELEKLDQLIELTNNDMHIITKEISTSFDHIIGRIEIKWLHLMLDLVASSKKFASESLDNWKDLRGFINHLD